MEIGSEFWLEDIKNEKKNKFFMIGQDRRFLLSGRTAIMYVINDILKSNKDVKRVYMPSFCCESMLQPFLEKDINIIYYNVSYNNKIMYNIDTNKKCDIFFAMNYFGFVSTNMHEYIKEFSRKGVIVIEDITHSLLCDQNYCSNSDYLVVSLRKWFPIITGGMAVKLKGSFLEQENYNENADIVKIKREAMLLKQMYINNLKNVNKDEYLKLYRTADAILDRDYNNYLIDKESYRIIWNLDIEFIKQRRKQNAKAIYKTLENTRLNFLIPKLEESDCPIFVPIYLDIDEKQQLSKFLIENQIYCPSHWPKPNCLCDSNLYNRELSLICDQRYTENQVKEYVEKIKGKLEGTKYAI